MMYVGGGGGGGSAFSNHKSLRCAWVENSLPPMLAGLRKECAGLSMPMLNGTDPCASAAAALAPLLLRTNTNASKARSRGITISNIFIILDLQHHAQTFLHMRFGDRILYFRRTLPFPS